MPSLVPMGAGCVAQLCFNPVPCLQTLPIIVFFSCVMSILYYLGVMQWLILKVGPHSWIWDGRGKERTCCVLCLLWSAGRCPRKIVMVLIWGDLSCLKE